MATFPTFQDFFDAARAEIEGDTEHQFKDFGVGSWLNAFAGVVAITGQGVMRFVTRRFLDAFVDTAEGAALDYKIFDLIKLERLPGQTDAEYKSSAALFIQNLARASPPALYYYATATDGVDEALVVEDFSTGYTTIQVTLDDDADEDETLTAIRAGLSAWRASGSVVNVELAT